MEYANDFVIKGSQTTAHTAMRRVGLGGTAHTEGKKEFAATDQDQVCVKKIQVVSKRRDASAGVGNAVCVYNSASLQQCQIFQVLTLSSVTSKNKCCCYYCVGLCCGCGIILSFIMMTLFAAAQQPFW